MNVTEMQETRIFNAAQILPQRLTWEEYLRFGEENTLAEWIDGRVIMLFSGSTRHQEIVGFLQTVVGLFSETHDLGRVFIAPYAMKLNPQRRGREPDVLFVSREREHLIERTFLNGAADLVVEIVSPESVERDSVQKFVEYETAGVREYWLIDYTNQTATFYQLNNEGHYQAAQVTDGIFRSTVLPGFFIRESWFWQERLSTLDALHELNIL
ncbi:MAG: Uma2 family endonuclease [Pyrinomonadaceae bacterium]